MEINEQNSTQAVKGTKGKSWHSSESETNKRIRYEIKTQHGSRKLPWRTCPQAHLFARQRHGRPRTPTHAKGTYVTAGDVSDAAGAPRTPPPAVNSRPRSPLQPGPSPLRLTSDMDFVYCCVGVAFLEQFLLRAVPLGYRGARATKENVLRKGARAYILLSWHLNRCYLILHKFCVHSYMTSALYEIKL